MRTLPCTDCGSPLAIADSVMLQGWARRLSAKLVERKSSPDALVTLVCPRCDTYVLGVETDLGMPFYSVDIGAFLTVHDWDWWNADPRSCDIRSWPDFGCLTFSTRALHSTIEYLGSKAGQANDASWAATTLSELADVLGIPPESGIELEWYNQLRILHERTDNQFTESELEAAVVTLTAALARHIRLQATGVIQSVDSKAQRLAALGELETSVKNRAKKVTRGAAQPESEQFFWNCYVAAKLIDEVQRNTATKACALYAVPKASVCYAGKNGVKFASTAASAKRSAAQVPWHKAGLVKEHVVPVSMMRERVVAQLDTSREDPSKLFEFKAEDGNGLSAEAATLFRAHPRAWQVGRIVRDLTVLAWVTKEEEKRFDEKGRHAGISLRKRMPLGWDGEDVLARYAACEIELVELERSTA